MTLDTIDTLFVAVPDLGACRPYEKLGLRLGSALHESRCLLVGRLTVRFLAEAAPLRQALAVRPGLFAVGMRVADLEAVVRHLASKGIHATRFRDGEADLACLTLNEQAGTDLVLSRHKPQAAIVPAHSFPLNRLDHLATVTHDLEAKTRYWADVLGVPVAGEVTTPAMVIRQLRIGDAVLELLGPASPDSPIAKRPPGLVSMASWEVDDLDDAVRQAREAGFTVPDPAEGVLPGTRVATIPGSELAGVNMQLLQYV